MVFEGQRREVMVSTESDGGPTLGVIKFGSRVDLYVPASYRILVEPGDRVRNGETPMAEAPETP